MSEPYFEWQKIAGGWEKGTDGLYVGRWLVGRAAYASRSKDDPNKYAAYSRLPGLKDTLGYFDSLEQAKQKVESATRFWFTNTQKGVIP